MVSLNPHARRVEMTECSMGSMGNAAVFVALFYGSGRRPRGGSGLQTNAISSDHWPRHSMASRCLPGVIGKIQPCRTRAPSPCPGLVDVLSVTGLSTNSTRWMAPGASSKRSPGAPSSDPTIPPTSSRSVPSSLIVRIVGHGTADAEWLWHSTTKAGADSRGVNAGIISGRVVVCAGSGAARKPLIASITPNLISTSTPVQRKVPPAAAAPAWPAS